MEALQFLYKYMSSETAELVLESQRLRWSCPSTFNDLSELQRMPLFSPTINEGKHEYLNNIIDIAFEDLSLVEPLSHNSNLLVYLVS
ncbi:hypothetical protein WN093_10965 [Gammaproteobacteria bacterium AS21]